MNEIYLWSVTGMACLISLNTIWRLFLDRKKLANEDLNEADRAFAWRAVVFIVFPLLNLLDLKATEKACQLLGGHVTNWAYGLLWYHIHPVGLNSHLDLSLTLFAGVVAQVALALLLIPALIFRPHPFLATVLGYTISFIFGLNLIFDPILSFFGMGSPRWQFIYTTGSMDSRLFVLALHASTLMSFCAFVLNHKVRLWFSELTRPVAADELKEALIKAKAQSDNARLACRLGLLYDKAGLRRRARKQLKNLKSKHPHSLYSLLLAAVLHYRKHEYKQALTSFARAAEAPNVMGPLKASLLAAAGCAAFADGEVTKALNYCERALEFDDNCLVARMVKVDVFLHQGKKETAAEEILQSMRRGLSLNLENKIPVDCEEVLDAIACMEDTQVRPVASAGKWRN